MSNAKQPLCYDKGEYILETNGSYSDYHTRGLYQAVCDLNIDEQFEIWVKETNRVLTSFSKISTWPNYWHEQEGIKIDEIGFFPWLLKNGLIQEIEFDELNTGIEYS